MQDFHDEAGRKEPSYLVLDDFSSVIGKAPQRLLHWPCIGPDMQMVISQLPRDTWQVLIRPCEDVLILAEEADELAFLFAI